MKILTIDAGANGALAFYNDEITVKKMPETPREIYTTIKELSPDVVYIEKVGTHIKGNNASSSVKLSKHYGVIIGVLTCLEIEYHEVLPQAWMKKLPVTLPHGTDNYSKRKTAIWEYVQSVLPKMKIYKYAADAIALLLVFKKNA